MFDLLGRIIITLFVVIGVATTWVVVDNYLKGNIEFKVCPDAITIQGKIKANKFRKDGNCSVVKEK